MVLSIPAVTFSQDTESCDFQYGTYKALTPLPVKVCCMASGLIGGKIFRHLDWSRSRFFLQPGSPGRIHIKRFESQGS